MFTVDLHTIINSNKYLTTIAIIATYYYKIDKRKIDI